jgi:hypothetical protein
MNVSPHLIGPCGKTVCTSTNDVGDTWTDRVVEGHLNFLAAKVAFMNSFWHVHSRKEQLGLNRFTCFS